MKELEQRWSICIGEPFQPGGQTAWVAPARTAYGEELVLKVAWRHAEALHEADGLQVWDGDGAVRLHADAQVNSQTTALLLERCTPGTTLADRPETDQDLIVAGLLRRLRRHPPAARQFRSLASMCQAWADEFELKTARGRSRLDPGLAREGIALFRELPASAEHQVLLCTDLHAGNVLAAKREPWLVIDPKPHVGDPTYDVLQHMLNRDENLRTDPRGFTTRMATLAGQMPTASVCGSSHAACKSPLTGPLWGISRPALPPDPPSRRRRRDPKGARRCYQRKLRRYSGNPTVGSPARQRAPGQASSTGWVSTAARAVGDAVAPVACGKQLLMPALADVAARKPVSTNCPPPLRPGPASSCLLTAIGRNETTRQGIDARLATLTTLAKAGQASWCSGRTGYREVPDEGDCGDG